MQGWEDGTLTGRDFGLKTESGIRAERIPDKVHRLFCQGGNDMYRISVFRVKEAIAAVSAGFILTVSVVYFLLCFSLTALAAEQELSQDEFLQCYERESSYHTVFALPAGETCGSFMKTVNANKRMDANSGVCFLNMAEGYEISYRFIIDDGRTQKTVEGGKVEPFYIQVKKPHPESPADAYTFKKNSRETIMYDLPPGYRFRFGGEPEIMAYRIISFRSLDSGETTERTDQPVYVIEQRGEGAFSGSIQKDGEMIYKVKKGDCMWDIAGKMYGRPEQWTSIYRRNMSDVKNPRMIREGQSLVIPVLPDSGP